VESPSRTSGPSVRVGDFELVRQSDGSILRYILDGNQRANGQNPMTLECADAEMLPNHAKKALGIS
jgi:hypothetical protein